MLLWFTSINIWEWDEIEWCLTLSGIKPAQKKKSGGLCSVPVSAVYPAYVFV